MKKFLVLLILAGAGVAGWWFYDPYLKPYLGPLWEKIAGPGDSDDGSEDPKPEAPKTTDKSSKPEPESFPTVGKSKSAEKAKAKAAAPKPQVSKSEIDLLVEKQYPFPEIKPLMEIVDNWKKVPPNAFPKSVAIHERVAFKLDGIGSSIVAPGNVVGPVRLQGDTLIIANLGNPNMRSQIAVDKTDFKQQIERRYADFTVNTRKRIMMMREKARERLAAKPEMVADLKSVGSGWHNATDPRFGPVKASIAAGEVTAFNADEAVGFRWNGSERINGDVFKGTYDTVTVKYEAKTIFGAFPGEAKCLLQGGKVIGWVDPFTEEERI